MKSKDCSPVRDFLNTAIPDETLYAINTMYILELKPGSTFRDALNASLLKRAESGDVEARELAERVGLL